MIFRYELKKIFQKKVNLITMLVGYVVLMVTTIYPIANKSEYIFNKDLELKGTEAVRYGEDFAANQTDILTEEYLTSVLREIKESNIDPNSDVGYLKLNDKYGSLFSYLIKSYRPVDDSTYRPETIFDVNIENGAQFYERRIQKIKDFVNSDFSYGNYTDAEKEYWIRKAESVKTPFAWGDTFVVNQYDTVIALVIYLLFVLIICLSPVFAFEYEKGTAGIILSTKHGQRKVVFSKCLAAYCFGFAYVFVGYLISFVWLYFNIGVKGFNLPVQLLDNAICNNINLGQFLLLQLFVSVVICFFAITLILFFSILTKSTIATMTILMAGFIIPAFIPFSKDFGLFNHVLALSVVRLVDLKECMGKFIDYQIGPAVLDLTTFSILVHIIVALVFTLFLRKIYVRRGIQN